MQEQQRFDLLIVDDDEMPPGHEWLVIEHRDGLLCVFARSATDKPTVLAAAWAASRRYVRQLPPLRATG